MVCLFQYNRAPAVFWWHSLLYPQHVITVHGRGSVLAQVMWGRCAGIEGPEWWECDVRKF